MGLSPAPLITTFPQASLRSRKVGFPDSGSDLGATPTVVFLERARLKRRPACTPTHPSLLPGPFPCSPALRVTCPAIPETTKSTMRWGHTMRWGQACITAYHLAASLVAWLCRLVLLRRHEPDRPLLGLRRCHQLPNRIDQSGDRLIVSSVKGAKFS